MVLLANSVGAEDSIFSDGLERSPRQIQKTQEGLNELKSSSQFQVDVLDPYLDLLDGPSIQIKLENNKQYFAPLENKFRHQQRKAGLLSSNNPPSSSFNFNDKDSHFGIESVKENKRFDSLWGSNVSFENTKTFHHVGTLRPQASNVSETTFSSDDQIV